MDQNIQQPSVPHDTYTRDEWQTILMNAHARLLQDPHNPRWLQAIRDANNSLNAYTQLDAQPTSVGQDISDVAGGLVQTAKGIPRGLGQVLGQLGHGDIIGAGKSVVGGLGATARGAMAPLELALNELAGQEVTPQERSTALRGGGAGLVGLESLALPGQLGRGFRALRGAPASTGEAGAVAGEAGVEAGAAGSAPTVEPTAPTAGPTPLELAAKQLGMREITPGFARAVERGAARPTEASPAGSTPAQPMSAAEIPGAYKGVEITGPRATPAEPAPSGIPEDALSRVADQIRQARSTRATPQDVSSYLQQKVPFEESAELPQNVGPRMSNADIDAYLQQFKGKGLSGEAGFTTPEILAGLVLLGTRLGGGAAALKALSNINLGRVAADVTGVAGTGAGMTPER